MLIGYIDGLWAGRSVCDSPKGQKSLLLPPIQRVSGALFLGLKGRGVKLIIHHLVIRSIIVKLYLYSSTRPHDIMLNELSTRTALRLLVI
jgi:hypothetical protein